MVHEIAPHRLINHYDPDKTARPEDRAVLFRRHEGYSKMLARPQGELFPRVGEIGAVLPGAVWRYLFTVDEEDYYMLEEPDLTGDTRAVAEEMASEPARPGTEAAADHVQGIEEGLPGFAWQRMSQLRARADAPREQIYAAFTAMHLFTWYRASRYCGSCGTRMVHHSTERAMKCPACGNTVYPRLMPAVIVGVVNGDKLLVTKYSNRPVRHYALVAGFTEIGETLEETVAREVMEETGLRVCDITYYKSQPWGIAQDILAGFYCRVDGSDRIRRDDGELAVAKWAAPEEIELQEDDLSLTNEMMKRFKEGFDPFL